MTDSKIDETCFTFTWILENASYCVQKTGEKIESPAFVVDEIHETKWRLWLYPRGDRNGNFIACYLYREDYCSSEDSVEVKYELALIDETGLNLTSHNFAEHAFLKGEGCEFSEFKKREEVFILDRSKFLPKGTLRVRCRIRKTTGDMRKDVRCFARTRIGVEKRSFVWKVKNISTLEPEKECNYLVKSLDTDEKLMSVKLSVAGGQNFDELIRFKITYYVEDVNYFTLKLFLVDIRGERVECNKDEFFIDDFDDTHRFTFLFSRQKLIEKKSLYLPNDALSLHWECVFSKGIVSEEIEEVQYGYKSVEQKVSELKKE